MEQLLLRAADLEVKRSWLPLAPTYLLILTDRRLILLAQSFGREKVRLFRYWCELVASMALLAFVLIELSKVVVDGGFIYFFVFGLIAILLGYFLGKFLSNVIVRFAFPNSGKFNSQFSALNTPVIQDSAIEELKALATEWFEFDSSNTSSVNLLEKWGSYSLIVNKRDGNSYTFHATSNSQNVVKTLQNVVETFSKKLSKNGVTYRGESQ